MFQEKLREVGSLIKNILLTDSFVENVRPKYLKEAIIAYPSRGGKSLRPALMMWCCGLFGEKAEKSIKIAAAVELYHIWTLVHDDIIDNDDYRRKAPSVHASIRDQCHEDFCSFSKDICKKFGTDLGILCGDIQQAWSNNLILQATEDGVSQGCILTILRRLNEQVNPSLISGEALDVQFTLLPITKISPEKMTEMLILKTGVLIRYAAECGALIGLSAKDFDDESVKKIGNFAEKAALAFQLKDDLLGMFADEAELGKPVGSDLREGKRTLLFSLTVNRLQGNDLNYFLDKLGKRDLRWEEVTKINELIIDCGAKEKVDSDIRKLLEEAEEDLNDFPDNEFRQLLADWVHFINKRTY